MGESMRDFVETDVDLELSEALEWIPTPADTPEAVPGRGPGLARRPRARRLLDWPEERSRESVFRAATRQAARRKAKRRSRLLKGAGLAAAALVVSTLALTWELLPQASAGALQAVMDARSKVAAGVQRAVQVEQAGAAYGGSDAALAPALASIRINLPIPRLAHVNPSNADYGIESGASLPTVVPDPVAAVPAQSAAEVPVRPAARSEPVEEREEAPLVDGPAAPELAVSELALAVPSQEQTERPQRCAGTDPFDPMNFCIE